MDYVVCFLCGLILGSCLVVSGDTVMVKGGKTDMKVVEYKDVVYRLVPLEDK
jgi:hypothetical protein